MTLYAHHFATAPSDAALRGSSGGDSRGGRPSAGAFERDPRVFDRNATRFTGHFDDRKI